MATDKVVYKSVLKKEKDEDAPNTDVSKCFGIRHLQTLVLFMCLSIAYSMRAQLSVSLVAMTAHSACRNETYPSTDVRNNTDIRMRCQSVSDSSWNVYRTYDWEKSKQEMIMFSFFVGYTSMMMPMGVIAQKHGGKLPILVALFANGILSILTPWLPISGGWIAICICRLLQGMTQAAFYPSIHTMLGKWAPLSERGRLSTYIYSGSQCGTVIAFQVAGLFASNPTLGWPATFWMCGVASFTCFGLFYWLGAATPYDHPSITAEELAYITEYASADYVPNRKTPWKQILTSTAVWALVASHAGSAVGYLFILTQIPTYMYRVLGVNIKSNGLYSSLPYIAMYFTALLFGYLSDLCVNKKFMSIVNIRRTANSIGMVVAAFFLIAFGYTKSTPVAVIMLVLCLSTHSGIHVGFHINQIDLAPNFAGPIMALGNMLANLSSLSVPVYVTNILGNDTANQEKWQILFYIIAGIQIFTNTIFVIFVKGKVQPWNFYIDEEGGTEKE